MGSIYDEITRLKTAKTDIETAIEECGVDVPDTKLISAYASYIRQIPSTVFSGFDVSSVGGDNKYIKTIELQNGLISATTGGLVSTTSSGLAPKIGTSASSTIATQSDEWVLTSTKGGSPTWRKLPSNAFKNDNTTYSAGSGLSLSDNTFSLKTGYTSNGKNYKVQLDTSGNPYVNVPWTDTNTDTNTWKANTASSEGYVAAGSGLANKVWKTDSNGVPAWRDVENADTVDTYHIVVCSLSAYNSSAKNSKTIYFVY